MIEDKLKSNNKYKIQNDNLTFHTNMKHTQLLHHTNSYIGIPTNEQWDDE